MDYEKYRLGAQEQAVNKDSPSLHYPSRADAEAVGGPVTYDHEHDVFGDEKNNTIRYKTMSWWAVAVLMIAEIVSNGMLCKLLLSLNLVRLLSEDGPKIKMDF